MTVIYLRSGELKDESLLRNNLFRRENAQLYASAGADFCMSPVTEDKNVMAIFVNDVTEDMIDYMNATADYADMILN